MRKEIAVFGSNQVTNEVYQSTYEIGKLLVDYDLNIITGGYGGVMEAVSRGVEFQNNSQNKDVCITGVVLPVKPKSNEFLRDTIIAKGTNLEQQFLWRASRLMKADGYIFIPGSKGTIYELHTVMQLRLIRSKILPKNNIFKPIIFHSKLGKWLEIIKVQNNGEVPKYMKDNVYFTITLAEFKSHLPVFKFQF